MSNISLYGNPSRTDTEQIAQTYHRNSLTPGQDLTGHPANVVAIAQAAWAPGVIAAYQEKLSQGIKQ